MYIPAHFLQQDVLAALELIEAEPFGMLLSVADGAPMISHIPFTIARRGPEPVLAAHVAKANPHWRTLAGARATAVFRGAHGYISPRWYTNPKRDVPTWNYEVVHCSGTVSIAPDCEKIAILRQLVDIMEAGSLEPWSVDELDARYREGLEGGIVALYLQVDQVEAKFKLGQNRAKADFEGAVTGLRTTGREGDRGLAAEMDRWYHPFT
ncbi:MAG: FMN-binding negative transcriptional regulator [Candidatus Eremiobacteraeota bacterium]|nr:FMN-binding negative transcriptional regulator [Candidatus Eremiobacteraeota bacterium]